MAGIASPAEIDDMSLDDVDLWHLYLDALEEAQIVPERD